MSQQQTRQINVRVSAELYAEIERLAGEGVPVATFVARLLERVIRSGRAAAEQQGELFERQQAAPANKLGLRAPQQVQIDPTPFFEPLRELYELNQETLRAALEAYAYLRMVAPAKNLEPTVMEARDKAARELQRWHGRNGGGP